MKAHPRRRTLWALLCAASVLAVAGCASYQAPALPAGDSAIVAVSDKTSNIGVRAIDGVWTSSLGGLGSDTGMREVTLAPGRHTITVGYAYFTGVGQTKGSALLTFDAQAGQRYVVHERSEAQKFYTWLTDKSGARVPLIQAASTPP